MKIIPDVIFTKNVLKVRVVVKTGDLVKHNRLARRRMRDAPRTECALRIQPFCTWHKQSNTEWARHVIYNDNKDEQSNVMSGGSVKWSQRVISIVAYCHSGKFCALALRVFRSQQQWHRDSHQLQQALLDHFCSGFEVIHEHAVEWYDWEYINR